MRSRRLKEWLVVLAVAGLIGIGWRLSRGLGESTALADGMPWGLWKIVNMVAGVALATGGFAMAFLVHVLGIRSLLDRGHCELVSDDRDVGLSHFLGQGAGARAVIGVAVAVDDARERYSRSDSSDLGRHLPGRIDTDRVHREHPVVRDEEHAVVVLPPKTVQVERDLRGLVRRLSNEGHRRSDRACERHPEDGGP